jgi:flagellar hook-basal body complex protein FliE
MTVNFSAALNAYNTAARISNNIETSGDSVTPARINGNDFSGIISSPISSSIASMKNAEAVVGKSLVKQADITDVVMAISKAELTLKTVIEVRDRLVAAHQDIMKMPI